MSEPLVSIIVNNFNYGRYLRSAIDSAIDQVYPHTELIVVDDGSGDNSQEVIASYRDSIMPILKQNGGQASAFNAGLRASQGEVVCFLDADDVLLPDAVSRAVPHFDDPGIATVHWPLRVIDERGAPTDEVLPRDELAEGDLKQQLIRLGPDCYQSSPTSGHAWSREFLERVFPIPEREYVNGADGYLITVTPLFGRIGRISTPLSCYRTHTANAFWTQATADRIERSLIRYETRAHTLAQLLKAMGVEAEPQTWRERNPYYAWMARLQAAATAIERTVPAGAQLILVDEAQWGSSFMRGFTWLPFLERGGQYWGPPADDDIAIAELRRMRHAGAEFLVVGWPAFWWLDCYARFASWLRATFPAVVEDDSLVIFDLRQSEAGDHAPRNSDPVETAP